VDELKKNADYLILGGGAVLFIASFFDWYSFDYGGISGLSYSSSVNGWETGLVSFLFGILPALLGLALAVFAGIKLFAKDVKLPEAPWGLIVLIAGVAAGALVLIEVLKGESPWDRAWGLYLAVVAGIVLAVGSFFFFQADQASSSGGASTPPPAPPTA